jgi:hypothetical protein
MIRYIEFETAAEVIDALMGKMLPGSVTLKVSESGYVGFTGEGSDNFKIKDSVLKDNLFEEALNRCGVRRIEWA